MKRLLIAVGLSLVLTGCFGVQSWNPAPDPGQGYGTWTHDSTDNGCNEWNSEPVAEVDNNGQLCKSVVP